LLISFFLMWFGSFVMPRPAVLLWVLAIVTAAALPLFAQPAGLLQELTHGYFSQGIAFTLK
jgi:hypothetical protein